MPANSNRRDPIRVRDARQNNLQGIDVDIPHDALTVITGVSGSGKSSLAFDTLYAEGQRRYVESLSAYARQFLERISKPDVGEIRGMSPAIAIRQKNTSRNPRSTVGTVTEIYDFLRLLFARAGHIRCRSCGREVSRDTVESVVESLMRLPAGARLLISFPFLKSRLDLTEGALGPPPKLELLLENLIKQGFHRLLESSDDRAAPLQLPRDAPGSVKALKSLSVLVDRLAIDPDDMERLADSIGLGMTEGHGRVEVTRLHSDGKSESLQFSEHFECRECEIPYRPPEPRLFSFNSPYGACPTCQGFGNTMTLDADLVIPNPSLSLSEGAVDPFTKPRYGRQQQRLLEFADQADVALDVPYGELEEKERRFLWDGDGKYPGIKGFFKRLERKKYKMHVRIFLSRYRGYTRCIDCDGERLRPAARDVLVAGQRISQLTRMPIVDLRAFFDALTLPQADMEIAGRLLNEIGRRLEFLHRVGLDYLTLDRVTSTLSGGEMQRIHLSASLSASLVGTLYVLDEPSVGLHPRDQQRLIAILRQLRDLGNTIVVVEHEEEIIRSADAVIDIGPGAGELGGRISHAGDLDSMLVNNDSLTGAYMRGDRRIPTPVFRRTNRSEQLVVRGARQHNLKGIDVHIPLRVLVAVTGVSGSGKSTLVNDVLYAGLKKMKGEWKGPVGRFDEIEGEQWISDALLVDQSPIGRTPRSNPVTYIKAFDEVRKLYASRRSARSAGLTPSHFSFNIAGGRCEACQGSGSVTVDLQFLADVELQCEECGGTRYQRRVLDIQYKGKNIDQALQLTVAQALTFFGERPPLVKKLRVLSEVGLGYLRLGQSATTLSGGEAQRVKLASYLARKTAGRPLFIFDEPTTGLHFDDIAKLVMAFDRLISRGASVVVIEHNLDVIKSSDWIIDLGPDGGDGGGQIVAEGPPEELAACAGSLTGQFLQKHLEKERGVANQNNQNPVFSKPGPG